MRFALGARHLRPVARIKPAGAGERMSSADPYRQPAPQPPAFPPLPYGLSRTTRRPVPPAAAYPPPPAPPGYPHAPAPYPVHPQPVPYGGQMPPMPYAAAPLAAPAYPPQAQPITAGSRRDASHAGPPSTSTRGCTVADVGPGRASSAARAAGPFNRRCRGLFSRAAVSRSGRAAAQFRRLLHVPATRPAANRPQPLPARPVPLPASQPAMRQSSRRPLPTKKRRRRKSPDKVGQESAALAGEHGRSHAADHRAGPGLFHDSRRRTRCSLRWCMRKSWASKCSTTRCSRPNRST